MLLFLVSASNVIPLFEIDLLEELSSEGEGYGYIR